MPEPTTNKIPTSVVARDVVDDLLPSEKWWRDCYYLLEKRGYRLRPRYHPDWIASWTVTGKSRLDCEDRFWINASDVIDASRLSDGTVVSLKRVRRYSAESSIAIYLSPSNDENEMNHCVPIIDHFTDDTQPNFMFLVMPLLRRFDEPPFSVVEQVLDFMKQTLEGLCYIHSRGVAHRDCESLNMMMDASRLFPQGFHPSCILMDPSGLKRAFHLRRRDVSGIQYYFIDFGISTRFEEGENHLVIGIDGRDRDVPELSDDVPYDPFAVDVFILGNVYRKKFFDKYTNFDFLSDMVRLMTAAKPDERPSADEAFKQFKELVSALSPVRRRWRLKRKDSFRLGRLFVDIGSILCEGSHFIKGLRDCASSASVRVESFKHVSKLCSYH